MSDTVRILGFNTKFTAVQALVPQVIADATPVLSAAIDTRSYPRQRILLVCTSKETTANAHTIGFDISESATSDGEYTAGTTSGTLTGLSADGVLVGSYQRNAAKPFIKVTATGSHADIDVICSAVVLFMADHV